jgi:cell division protein ZipA
MNASSLFILLPFLAVIAITAITVFYKKKQLEKNRRRHREPRFVDSLMAEEPEDNFDVIVVKKTTPEATVQSLQKDIRADFENDADDYANEDDYEEEPASSSANNLIVIYLIANQGHPYSGYELLQALLTAGLRFGKMNIFHRHEEVSGRGESMFSLASVVEPGIFEMNKMGSFSSPGLALFLRINKVKDPLKAFEIMLTTAQQLIDDLGGEICDEHYRPLSAERIADYRSQILAMSPVMTVA